MRTPGQRVCGFSFELQTLPFQLCCWAAGCQHHRAGAEYGGCLGAFGTHSPELTPDEKPQVAFVNPGPYQLAIIIPGQTASLTLPYITQIIILTML